MVADGAFLEHAAVFDNFYGTSLQALQDAFGAGFDVVLEIDWQGARQVREKVPECISIFILPPSRPALEQRLRDRRTDSPEVIARRLSDAVTDMGHYARVRLRGRQRRFRARRGRPAPDHRRGARFGCRRRQPSGPTGPELAPLVAGLLG